MNPTTSNTVLTRIQALGTEVLGPVSAPHGSSRRTIQLARLLCAYGTLLATLVQVVVWLMIAVFSGNLDTPWWLWTAVPGAAAVGALTLLERWRTWWTSASTHA